MKSFIKRVEAILQPYSYEGKYFPMGSTSIEDASTLEVIVKGNDISIIDKNLDRQLYLLKFKDDVQTSLVFSNIVNQLKKIHTYIKNNQFESAANRSKELIVELKFM